MTFSNDLSQGVSFSYGDYTITLRPETVSTATTIMQAEGKVLYRNAFGATAHLAYTPQLNGLKEDIVLTSYNGTNTFSFILNTDGLIPASDVGGYYLHDGTDMQIRLGQVVSYDANGDFSIGEMTVEPIGGTRYRVTLTVDEEFLEDAFYPVTVDPSIFIEEGVLFDDATIFNTDQNRNLNDTKLHVGFLETEAVRSILRPIGLENNSVYANLRSSQINLGILCLYSDDNKSLDIQVYRNRVLGWNESSVCWDQLDMYQVSESATTFSGKGIGGIDITTFMKNWKNSVWSTNEGIVLVADNEPFNANFKSFSSGETQNSPYLIINYTVSVVINSNGKNSIMINEKHKLIAYTLPEEYDVIWESQTPSIATIDSNGVVTGKSGGTAVITATISIGNSWNDTDVAFFYIKVYCGEADVKKHNYELDAYGYYKCSRCTYKIKSPALQDEEVLNKSDYLTIVSLYHEYLVVVKDYPIYADQLLAMIDAIRGLPENAYKYEYCDSNGKYVPEYNKSFGDFHMYINVNKGICLSEWVLLNALFSIVNAAIPQPYSFMFAIVSSLVLSEHSGADSLSGSDIVQEYASYLLEENILSKAASNAISILLTFDNIINGTSCSTNCYTVNIVMVNEDAPYDLYQVEYHFFDGAETMGRGGEYKLDGTYAIDHSVDYIDHVNEREYTVSE